MPGQIIRGLNWIINVFIGTYFNYLILTKPILNISFHKKNNTQPTNNVNIFLISFFIHSLP